MARVRPYPPRGQEAYTRRSGGAAGRLRGECLAKGRAVHDLLRLGVANGEARSWENLEGASSAIEAGANGDAESTAGCAEVLRNNHKEWLIENPAPSGRYPTFWDLGCHKRLKRNTDARAVAMDVCEWDHRLDLRADAPEHAREVRVKHRTWWLVSKRLCPYAQLLGRLCTRRHAHFKLPGRVRTRAAGRYAAKLCITRYLRRDEDIPMATRESQHLLVRIAGE